MHKKLLQTTLGMVTALLLFATPQTFAADTKPIDVLISGQHIRFHSPFLQNYQDACRREGVDIHFSRPDRDTLSLDYLKQFQVVLFHGLPKNEDEAEQLAKYHRAGGGLLWTPVAFKRWPILWNDRVGRHYDARALAEDLYDPPKLVDVQPEINKPTFRYLWTTAVEQHPVTEGVEGLFLPTTGEWSWPGTVPMAFGPEWQVLLRGMDSTRTIGHASPGSGAPDFRPDIEGSYPASPQIVGVREGRDGAGRMMVFPVYSAHTIQNFGHPLVYNDALMLNGYGGRPSDGHRLLLNAYRWLAEPATKAGLGGYTAPEPPKRDWVSPKDWQKEKFRGWDAPPGGGEPEHYRGLIGARTVASNGEGTVAEYVAAARAAGLSFIVFAEDLAHTDAARYAGLVAECAVHSTNGFLAVPGYLARDTQGVEHFFFNTDSLPLADNLTPDRRVRVPNRITIDRNPLGYGAEGIARLGAMPLDPWYLLSFSCIALYTYEGARLVDDGYDRYLGLQGRMHHHPPVSFTVVKRPDELVEAVPRVHLPVIVGPSPRAFVPAATRKAAPPNLYISNGPRIDRWGLVNGASMVFRPGGQRFRVELHASSPTGLREVKIVNALTGKAYRRFDAGGAKTFRCSIDESHKTQWYLFPVVTDVEGGTAIGPTRYTLQNGNRMFAYGDNIDAGHICRGWNTERNDRVDMEGWAGAWHKGRPAAGRYPPNPHAKELTIFGFDGAKVHSSALDILPTVTTEAGTEPAAPAFYFSSHRLASLDCAVVNFVGDTQFTKDPREGASGWWATPDPPVPNEIADIHGRVWAVRPRHRAPVSANVNEITYTFKKDAVLERAHLASTRMWRCREPLVMGKDRDGAWTCLVRPGEAFSRRGVLDPGGYLYPANEPGGAVGLVNLGPEPIHYHCEGSRSVLYLDGRPVEAGEQLTARLLTFMRPWQGQNNTLWLHKFIADYAIGGGEPGYSYEVRQGTLKKINYAMELEARDGGAVVEVEQYDLPHNLLVKVEGIPGNAVAGRYDLNRKQLLILPVFEETATTSINTTLGDTLLYIGELFHCDSPDVVLSCVQDGADKLLLEVHNPTDKPQSVKLSAAPGFKPLAGLNKSLKLAPFSSTKLELPTPAGTLVNQPYMGD
jgi:hypothetical protein